MLSNAEIKKLVELKDKQGRKEQGLFLIEGKRAVIEALSGGASVRKLVVNAGASSKRVHEALESAEELGIQVEEVPAAKFSKIASTETSQGIIAVAVPRELSLDELINEIRPKRSATLLLLDRISDPGNLGTIMRSAAWFGIDGIVVSAGSVDAYNPKVVRSAMAAICQLDVVQDAVLVDVIGRLNAIGFAAIASVQGEAQNYSDFTYPGRSAIVFGSEASGIDSSVQGLCGTSVTIPRVGKMESLNVGVAASIVLSEIARQRIAARRNL